MNFHIIFLKLISLRKGDKNWVPKRKYIHRCQLKSQFPSKRFLQLMAEDIARERMRVGTMMVIESRSHSSIYPSPLLKLT